MSDDNTQDDTQADNGGRHSLIEKIAERYHVEPAKMMNTLKSTAFRQKEGQEITNEQMMALLIVADQYRLNPFTKEIYAFPDKNQGIVPIVGVDGWSRIINGHDRFDGMHFEADSEPTEIDKHHKQCPASITCTIYRKDRAHPVAITEYLDEVYRPPFQKNGQAYYGPWQTHTKRFLRHKSMIQCARIAFGFVGIYDQDEAERIVDGEVIARGSDAKQASLPDGLNDEQVGQIEQLIQQTGEDRQAMLEALGAEDISAIPQATYPNVLQRLLDKRKALTAEETE